DISATVTFSYNSVLGGPPVTTDFAVTIMTVPVQDIYLDESSITGAGTVNGTVDLVQAAPAGGVNVDLSSDNPAVTVPSQVTVPAGATYADFQATVTPVSTAATVNISATSGATTVTTPLDVEPVLATTTAIAVTPAGGVAISGETVTLTAKVTPITDAGAAADNGSPTGTVTFNDGATTLATFDVDAAPGSYADEA